MGDVRTYRTWLPLRLAVGAAAGFWAAALIVLLKLPGTSPVLIAGASAFVAFFTAFTIVYGRTSITVTREGIVVAGPFRRKPVRFDEILRVVVQDGLGGRAYSVLTRRGVVQFTSLFARHRELFEVILRRARLQPLFG